MDLVWEDPPVRAKHGAIADALRANPHRWALWPHSPKNNTAAYNLQRDIRAGHLAGFAPSRAFEATARVVDDVWSVYVRYVGTGTAAAPEQPATLRVAR